VKSAVARAALSVGLAAGAWFALAAGAAAVECGEAAGDYAANRGALLDAAKAEIDAAQAARDALAADPDNIRVVQVGGAILAIDKQKFERDLDVGLTVAAAIAYEIIQSSPTAAEMAESKLGDAVGNAVGDAMSGAGLSSDIADLAGWAVGKAAQSLDAASEISEEQIRGTLADLVQDRLDAASMTLDQLDAAIATRWKLLDWIDAHVGGTGQPSDAGAVADFSGRWACAGRGNLVISQVGAAVAGDFSGLGGGRGDWGESGLKGGSGVGQVSGNHWCMAVEWGDGSASNLDAALSTDGQAFSGAWDWRQNGEIVASGQWGCGRP